VKLKTHILLLAGLFCTIGGMAHGEVLSINRFGGLDTDNDPLLAAVDRSPDSENVVTDAAFGLQPREGFVQFSTEPGSQGPWMFPHSNGNRYLITFSSNVLKATLGGTNFTIIIGTADPAARVAAATLGDKFYWSTTWGLQHWDGTTMTVDSTTLVFDNLVAHKGRLWGSGVPGDRRTIYVSKYLNGSDFALKVDPTDEDPTRIQVQGSLDENISVLFASFADMLIWAKASSFGGIQNSKRSTFSSKVFSDNVGSAYPESFRDCDGHLRFLGTKRTVWDFSGEGLVSLTNGKERINELMKTVVQGDSIGKNWTQTTAADWNSGTVGLNLSTTVSLGDVVFPSAISANDNFDDNNYTTNPTWEVTSGSFNVTGGALKTTTNLDCGGGGGLFIPCRSIMHTPSEIAYGYWHFDPALNAKVNVVGHIALSFIGVQRFGDFIPGTHLPQKGYTLLVSTAGLNNYLVELARADTSGSYTVLISSTFPKNAGSFDLGDIKTILIQRTPNNTFYLYRRAKFNDPLNNDKILLGSVVDATYTTSSEFGIGYVPREPNTGGASSFTYNNLELAFISIFGEGVTYSTYTSQVFNIGSRMTAWGTFTANNQLNGGTIQYGIYADTDSTLNIGNPTTFIASQTITSGQVPTIPVSTYVAVSAYFTKTFSTQAPAMNDFQISWIEGNPLRVSSLWTGQRYWLGCAISSTTNNIVLVYDRNGQWQKWRGINMDGAVIYNSDPYFSNSLGIFQADIGDTDNGVAITSYYRSKRFVPSGINYFTFFDDFYMTTANSADTLATQYFVDGVNTPFSLANYIMNTQNGIQDVRLPFASTSLQQGRSIEFLWTVTGTTNWRIVNANLYYTPEPVTTGN
jgi:hypothetical protein